MEQAELEAFTEQVIAAWNAEGVAGMEPFLSEDFEFHSPREIPGGGAFVGREAALDFMRTWEAGGGGVRLGFSISELIETDGDEELVVLNAASVGDASGVELPDQQWFQLVQLRGRKIARLRAFLDREEALQAAGL